ncbi:hypothetical protein Q8F55_003377 [Vanrija albida]|uniref:Uncharacterized protein n=1 Tax=Vanrija albida TaxID=181172 RepID=A0ABR3Q3R9_9TREE
MADRFNGHYNADDRPLGLPTAPDERTFPRPTTPPHRRRPSLLPKTRLVDITIHINPVLEQYIDPELISDELRHGLMVGHREFLIMWIGNEERALDTSDRYYYRSLSIGIMLGYQFYRDAFEAAEDRPRGSNAPARPRLSRDDFNVLYKFILARGVYKYEAPE